MEDGGNSRDYRLLELSPEGRPRLRVMIYHPRCERYTRALSREVLLCDITEECPSSKAFERVDVLWAWKCPDSVLASLTSLKWIQTTTAGVDHVLDYYRRRPNLIVTTTKGLHAEPVSSLVLMMMLVFRWRLPLVLQRQRRHLWESQDTEVISRSTCAVVGLGHIGRMVARHAKHLGMTVLGMKRQAEPVENVDRLYAPEQLHEMLASADFVVLALPLTERTRGMFGEAEFQTMKRSAYLINVARGGIVDEGALVRALQRGEIGGAAVDVAEEEPLPPHHPLWDAPNIIITPHVAGERNDYVEAATSTFVQNLLVFPDRSRMKGLADAVLGY